MSTERAAAIERQRAAVELLQRDLQIAQAELRLLELDHEQSTITETLTKLRGLRSDQQVKLTSLTHEE